MRKDGDGTIDNHGEDGHSEDEEEDEDQGAYQVGER